MTKTVQLADDAYELLAAQKREGESFSQVIRRMLRKEDVRMLVGVLSNEEADELEAFIEEGRARDRESMERRLKGPWP